MKKGNSKPVVKTPKTTDDPYKAIGNLKQIQIPKINPVLADLAVKKNS